MKVYYATILLTALFSIMAELFSCRHTGMAGSLKNEPRLTKLLLFLAASILIFVAGLRYNVGADYGAYSKLGFQIFDDLEESLQTFDEPGLRILVRILSWFTDDGAYITFTCSVITIGLFLFTAYKNEPSYAMVTMLFILVGIWSGSFNGVRQYFAAAILFAGHRLIYERKIWKYLLCVFIATCFHLSAVVMVVLYFLLRNKLTARNIILLVLGTAIISANYDTIFSLIGLLKVSDTASQTVYANTTVNILRVLVACAPAGLCLILYWGKETTEEQTFYINALIIHASAMVAASDSAYLARITIYTSPFVVVALPKLIRFDNKRLETLTRIGIIFLYAVFWYIGISESNVLREFHWIWER